MSKDKLKTSLGLEGLGELLGSEPSDSVEQEPIESEFEELNPNSFNLRVFLDKKQRKGKAVTLVTGFGDLHPHDLKDLAKMLKAKCGVGGGAKNQEIFVQGDHITKVMELLKAEGFRVKHTGR
jgi:translation initiation factor 1